LAFSHRITVLRHGKNAGEIQTDQADEQKIARMMVGSETLSHTREMQENGPALLRFKRVSVQGRARRDSLKNVDLTVFSGEILGIAGVSGNGQTALAGVISGMLSIESGEVLIEEQPLLDITPAAMISRGVGRIPEDRHRDGIVGSMSVAENMVIEQLDDPTLQRNGLLRRDAIRDYAETLSSEYDVRGPGAQASARLLSGGNIQKLILARVFDRSPKLILANQPTRGLDMGAASEVARRLLEARGRGAGIVLISEDLDEILKLSDRILVVHDGAFSIAKTRDRAQLGLMMAGQAA